DLGPQIWPAVVRNALQYRPNMPIFVIYSKKRPKMQEEEARKLGICGLFAKPLTYRRIAEIFGLDGSATSAAEATTEAQEQPAQQPEAAPALSDLNDIDVVEVDFTKISGEYRSTVDLYVRLGNGKFVRILVAGDKFSAERIASYKAKGVTKLYTPKAAHAA